MRKGQRNTPRRVNSRRIQSSCSTNNTKEKSRAPLHSTMLHLMFTIAALPATIDAVATNFAPSAHTNALTLLNTARQMREQRLNEDNTIDLKNNDARTAQIRLKRVQSFSQIPNDDGYGTYTTDQSTFILNNRPVPSLHQQTATQHTTSHNINQFLSSKDLIWGDALFDDNVVDTSNVLVSYKIIEEKPKVEVTKPVSRSEVVEKKSPSLNESRRRLPMEVTPRTKSSGLHVHKIKLENISTIMSAKKLILANKAAKDVDLDETDENSSSTSRVSREEELQLAYIIQRGAELNLLKSKFEKKEGRDITRQEWTDLAKLDSPKELRRLVSNYRRAKNKLVMANLGLVHAVVRARLGASGSSKNIANTPGGISYEELVQEGSLGLLRAAELFDPSKGLRFSTYATIWVKGILGNNSLGETITLPLREKNKWNKIQKVVQELSIENNEKTDGNGSGKCRPSHKDIASRGGMRSEDVKKVMTKMKRAKNVLSLDYQYDSHSRSGTESHQHQAFSGDKNLMDDVDFVEKLQLQADVVAALSRNLDPREAQLMRLRYGLKDGRTRTIEECAKTLGISKARVQQLAVGCLKKLREADDAKSLQEYLLSVA